MTARETLQTAALVVLSGALTLLGVEIALLFVVDVTDRIDYVAVPGVGLGLRPNQEGRFIRSGIDARFHINGSGFNNPHEYVVERSPGLARIAVVGDSFVEAFQVNPEEAFFSVLGSGLEADGIHAQVYSFGVSGFGTAQVYRLIQDTVLSYLPDMVVYVFIRNDVTDSSPCLDRAAWTQQYDLTDDGRLEALPVGHYTVTWWSNLLKESRLFRYLFYQRRLLELIRNWRQPPAGPVLRGTGDCADRSWRIVEALLAEMKGRLERRGIPLVVLWQGDNDPNYAADVREGLKQITARQGIQLIDPSPAFEAEAGIQVRSFRIPGDGHWNADGHRVVGKVLVPVVERLLVEEQLR